MSMDRIGKLGLRGKTVAVQGSLKYAVNHDTFREWVEKHGGKFVEEVTDETDYLVTDNLQNAVYDRTSYRKNDLCIVTEMQIIDIVKDLERGYAVVDFDSTGMLEIERIDEAGVFDSDEAAVEQVIKDGVKLIPVEELPENFDRRYLGWIDTPDNREAIRRYCEK